jgi:hypothetical protein
MGLAGAFTAWAFRRTSGKPLMQHHHWFLLPIMVVVTVKVKIIVRRR